MPDVLVSVAITMPVIKIGIDRGVYKNSFKRFKLLHQHEAGEHVHDF